nr:aldehyde dehydrogenase family protein [Caldibacillus debilis]
MEKLVLVAVNPATGERIEEIEETDIGKVQTFYENSRRAFSRWSGLSLDERLGYFRRLKKVMAEAMDEIAKTVSLDTGKVPTDALVSDVMPTIESIEFVLKHVKKSLSPQKVKTPLLLFGKTSCVEYMPRGVVLVISPWNYPLQLAMVPAVSALAGGNTVILKPSEVTPLVGKLIESLFQRAGFPEHVLQVAHGGKEVGSAFVNGKPDYIFFTGSVKTGKIIQKAAAEHLIPTTLELGGKDPFIVFADANLERAAKGAVWAAFTNCGQVCMSAERIFVEKSVFPEFVERLKEETRSLVLGQGEDADIGSMTFPGQKEIVREHVLDALARGAKLETGEHPDRWTEDSLFVKPMVMTNVPLDAKIMKEETFGPVLPVVPFETEEEAVKLANDTEYGLNASVWSNDLERARRVAAKLVSGAVVINDAVISVANPHLPFGGAKNSGIGRYHGKDGLRIFCHEKALVIDRGRLKREVQWYPYKGTYPLFLRLFQSYFGERKNWFAFFQSFLRLMKRN